jgi:RimJ/RimL family protein N-acetyltransferase
VPRGENKVIGDVTLELDRDEPRGAGFSYVLHRGYLGQGYTAEVMRTLLDFSFDHLTLNRIHDACDVRNLASAHVMEKLGLRREGHVRERLWSNGGVHDEYQYAILAREWTCQREG